MRDLLLLRKVQLALVRLGEAEADAKTARRLCRKAQADLIDALVAENKATTPTIERAIQ